MDKMYIVNAEDLRAVFAEMYERIKTEEQKKQEEQSKEDRKYYNKEAQRYLGVNDTTLWRWKKMGYLVPDGHIGGRPYYMKSTLDRLGKEE